MHVTAECRNKSTRERRGLRGCERKAPGVACVQFCDRVIKFQESKSCACMINIARLELTCQYHFRALNFTSRLVTENVLEKRKCFI